MAFLNRFRTLPFQHTAARRRLLLVTIWLRILMSFNTQPRGGGCLCHRIYCHYQIRFNTQPRGGGCSKRAK